MQRTSEKRVSRFSNFVSSKTKEWETHCDSPLAKETDDIKTSSQNKITLCQNFFGVLQLNLQSFDKNNLEHFVDRLNRRNPKIKD